MKEFRIWWEEHRASRGPHTCQSSRGENLAQLADEEIWRAALERVLQASEDRTCGMCYTECMIDEELES